MPPRKKREAGSSHAVALGSSTPQQAVARRAAGRTPLSAESSASSTSSLRRSSRHQLSATNLSQDLSQDLLADDITADVPVKKKKKVANSALPPLRESSEFVGTALPAVSQLTYGTVPYLRPLGSIGSCVWFIPDETICANPQLPVEKCGHDGCARPVHHVCQTTCEFAHAGSELEGGKKRCPHHHPFFSNLATNGGNPLIGGVVGGGGDTSSPLSAISYTQRIEPSPAKSTTLQCSAREFCSNPDDFSGLADMELSCVCINCNFATHNTCAIQLFLQTPRKEGSVDYHEYLGSAGATRLKEFKGDREELRLCKSCKVDIDNRLARNTSVNDAPKKGTKKQTIGTVTKTVIKELKDLATLQALVFVFKQEQMKTEDKENAMYTEFHGNETTKKGTATQLIDGDGLFSQLYDTFQNDGGEERVLKDCFCLSSSFRFVVGRDITLESISFFSDGTKRHTGKTLLKNGMLLLRNLKKSLKVVEALSPHIVQVHPKNLRVLSFSSGQNMTSFMQKVNDGMFAIDQNDNCLRSKNKMVSESATTKDADNGTGIDGEVTDWDPFSGVVAKEGWTFHGYISFRVVGPVAAFGTADAKEFYCPLLQQAVEEMNRDERKRMGRSALRTEAETNANANRSSAKAQQLGNIMSLQTQCDIATIALGQAEAQQRVLDRNLLSMSKQIDTKKLDINIVLGLLSGCDDPEEVKNLRAELYNLRRDIKTMDEELKLSRTQAISKNDIVDKLLSNATTAMKTAVEPVGMGEKAGTTASAGDKAIGGGG